MEQKLLKKGKKIKIGNEDFIVENFKDEESFDEELNEGIKNKEIILRNEDKNNQKLIRQKVFLKKSDNAEQAGVYREMNSANKFKNGFIFQSQKVFVGRNIVKLKEKKNKND